MEVSASLGVASSMSAVSLKFGVLKVYPADWTDPRNEKSPVKTVLSATSCQTVK